jgi:catecholate siderophore receptor
LNAAVFRAVKTNARTDDPFFAGDQSSFDTLNGEQRIDGFEFSVSGQLSDQWLLIAAYTHQDSEVTHAEGDDVLQVGNALPRTPANSASLWSLYDFNDQWAIGFGAQYLSKRYNSSDLLSREKADGYATFDMMASYQVTDSLGLQLNGTNLADEEYEDQLGGGHFIPGQGRYIRINARYTFD